MIKRPPAAWCVSIPRVAIHAAGSAEGLRCGRARQVGVDIAKSFSYNNIGNILIKSDVGNYTYPAPGQPFPHARDPSTSKVPQQSLIGFAVGTSQTNAYAG